MQKSRLSDWLARAEERRRRATWGRRDRKREAGRELLAADPIPAPDIRELKGELDEIRAGAHEGDHDPRHAADLLDGIAGAHERALLGREQAKSTKTIPLDDI